VKLGLDLDGCVYDFVGAFRTWLGRPELPEPDRWEIWEAWGLSREEWRAAFREGVATGAIFAAGRPYRGAVEAVRYLAGRGWEVHVVTHRLRLDEFEDGQALLDTYRWLRRWEVPYETLTFAADKATVPCDVYVEDSLANARALAAADHPVALLDRPWNRTDEELSERVLRCTWEELVDRLRRKG